MSDSIDPEILRQINEHLSAMSDMLGKTNSAMGDFAKGMQGAGGASKQNADAVNQNSTAQKNAGAGAQALADAEKQAADQLAEEAANIKRAGGSAVMALGQFGDALLSGQKGFSKYNNALGSAGDAALTVGKNFGLLGLAAGALIKAFTMVQQAVNKQMDDQINFRENIGKMGGAVGTTTNELAGLGRNAGYASGDLEKLVKPLQTAGKGLLSLGSTVGEGTKSFLEMANVGSETREKFKRLGISQEELTDMQAAYVSQQQTSLAVLQSEVVSRKALKESSIEYAENLVKLSALTGKSADQMQKDQQAAQLEFEEEVKTRQENIKIKELEAAGDKQGAAQMMADQKARKAMINQMSDLYGKETAMQVAHLARTGTYDEKTKGLATLGVNAAQVKQATIGTQVTYDKEGKVDTAASERIGRQIGNNIGGQINKGIDNTVKNAGDSLQFTGEKGAAALGFSKEALEATQNTAGMTPDEYNKRIEEAGKATEKTGKEGTDTKADRAAKLQEIEIKARIKTDGLITSASNHMTALTVALGAATAAIGGLIFALRTPGAVGSAAGGLLSKLTKPLGGAAGIAGGTGGAVNNIGKVAGVAEGASSTIKVATGVEKAAAGSLPVLEKAAESGAGKGVGGFIEGVGQGLAGVGKVAPQVIAGAGAISAAIALIGAGVAGATWILGEALPNFAKGLKSFNDVDGDNLKQVGLGMAGLGAGVIALGAGAALNAMTGLARLFTGQKDPLTEAADQLLQFQSYDINGAKVKNNADAFVAFSDAMSKYNGGPSEGLIGSITNSITGFFGTQDLPFDKFTQFSELDVGDPKSIKDKASAFVAFSDAMSNYKGGANEGAASAISNSITTFFSTELPYSQFTTFSNLNIADPKAVKDKADAFVAFSKAMSEYKGGSASAAASDAISESVTNFFKSKPPINQFENFAKLSVDPDKTTKNAKAFADFATAMASYKGGPGGFSAVSSMIGAGVTKLFGGDGPVAAFKKFSEMDFGKKAGENADAFHKYAQSMGLLSGATVSGAAPSPNQGGSATSGAQTGGAGGGATAGTPPAGPAGTTGTGGASSSPTGTGTNPGESSGGTNASAGGTAGAGAGSGPTNAGSVSKARFTVDGGDATGKGSTLGGNMAIGSRASAAGAGGAPGTPGGAGGGDADVKSMIKRHEGVRNTPYKDSKGLWTVGVGHLIGDGRSLPPAWNRTLSDKEVDSLFDDDYEKHRQAAEKIPGFGKLKPSGQGALTDLTFNMGPAWYQKWPNFTKQIESGDTAGAADNLLGSPYAKQVGKRAYDNANLLKAKSGGMFDGPTTGYPIEMHGSELVAPLDPNSILMQLAKEPAKPETVATATKEPGIGNALPEMIHMMGSKLDKVISVLENSHRTNEKILKHTKV